MIGPLKLSLQYNNGFFAWGPQLPLEAPPLSLEAPPLPAKNTTLDHGSQPSCDVTPGLPPEESSGAEDPPPELMPAILMSIISAPGQSISEESTTCTSSTSSWLSDEDWTAVTSMMRSPTPLSQAPDVNHHTALRSLQRELESQPRVWSGIIHSI